MFSKESLGSAGVSPGLKSLDESIGSLARGALTVIASKPGDGKTSLALQICSAAAKRGQRALFVSSSMSEELLAMRVLCSSLGIDASHARTGELTDDEMNQIVSQSKSLSDLPLTFYCRSRLSFKEVAQAIGLFDPAPVVICIDDLQKVAVPNSTATRTEQIDMVASELRAIAMECNAAMLATCNLLRQEDRAPSLSHLGNAKSIEAVADVVLAINQIEANPPKCIEPSCELIILKNRFGKRGAVPVKWIPEFTRFEDLS